MYKHPNELASDLAFFGTLIGVFDGGRDLELLEAPASLALECLESLVSISGGSSSLGGCVGCIGTVLFVDDAHLEHFLHGEHAAPGWQFSMSNKKSLKVWTIKIAQKSLKIWPPKNCPRVKLKKIQRARRRVRQ